MRYPNGPAMFTLFPNKFYYVSNFFVNYRSQGQQNKSKSNGNFEGFSGNLTLGIPGMVNAR